jgi:hypothetical protein
VDLSGEAFAGGLDVGEGHDPVGHRASIAGTWRAEGRARHTGQMSPDTVANVRYREVEEADLPRLADILVAAVDDFGRRTNVIANSTAGDTAEMAWERRRSLWEHLHRTAEASWVAVREGRLVGYARTINRGGLRELTEYFVLPGEQSAGIGGELLARAFPTEGAAHRVIVATSDLPALSRYLRTGLAGRFPIYTFEGSPSDEAELPDGLAAERLDRSPAAIELLAAVDVDVLGHRRDVDHEWLLGERRGWLYRRAANVVGYGYHGDWQGPFAVLDEADMTAVLAHAEVEARRDGRAELAFEVPLVNKAAVGWLLARRYRMNPFFTFLLSDEPFGAFERYIHTSPPVFL